MQNSASTYAPEGLIPGPAYVGITRPGIPYQIESTYNTNIYLGYPVAIDANGFLVVAAAGDDVLWLGAFGGVEYTDSLGKRVYSPKWLANTVATEIVAYVTNPLDPYMVYMIQSNATLTIDAIGGQANFTTLSGNAVTGLATVGLDASTLVESADQKQMRVVGLVPGPDNNWGDTYPWLLVQNSAHPWVARLNAT